jgi:uncharacterized protein (DUF1330 family)
MSQYVIYDVTIKDLETYMAYMLKVKPVIEAAGGRYLVRGGAHEVLEGEWHPTRLVVIEFPSADAARSFYLGPEYGALKALRESCSTASLVSVAGV